MINQFVSVALATSVFLTQTPISPIRNMIMSSASLNLAERQGFRDNILLAVDYLNHINEGNLILQPGEIFAFHNQGILPEFKNDKIISQESDFTTNSGYKVVAGLGGNGVCHLASLMNLVATKAGLEVMAPTNHNFVVIPGIDKEYGTSISTRNSPERQNLYIKNNKNFPVVFVFNKEGDLLRFSILALQY